MITTIIPTLNEAVHVERAVMSVRVLGPVLVVDCGSTDDTVAKARSAGAAVVHQDWLGHAAQKNWALDNLQIETDWVLFLDADETVTSELRCELQSLGRRSDVAYWIPRSYWFLGRELRHAWWYPDYQLRLFKPGHARYEERSVHEHMLVTGGTAGRLRHPLRHENNKGIDAFMERHLRYARQEADEIVAAASSPRTEFRLNGVRARTRRAVKTRLWYRLRGRPAIRFLWLYVIRGGFRDGLEGRIFIQLICAYEAMIDAFVAEAFAAREQ